MEVAAERLLIDSAQRSLLSPKLWCTWGRRHQGNLPAMLVGDVDYGRDARDRQHGLWKALRAAARAEATRAQAKLRDVVETHVGGKGDLQQPDLVALQLLVTISFVAHNGYFGSVAGADHVGLPQRGGGGPSAAAASVRATEEVARRRDETHKALHLVFLHLCEEGNYFHKWSNSAHASAAVNAVFTKFLQYSPLFDAAGKAPPPRAHGRPVPTVGEGTRWAEVAPFLGFRYRKYKLSDEQQRAYNKNEMFMLSDAAIRTLARPPATTGAEQLLIALGSELGDNVRLMAETMAEARRLCLPPTSVGVARHFGLRPNADGTPQVGGLYHADDLRANHVRRLLGREVPTPEIEPILAWPNGRPWEPGRWSYGGHGTTARWIPSKDPQPPEVRLSMEAAEAAAVAASLDEAEVARKMLMWGAQEGPLQATRAEATRASGAVVAAPGNANIGDILEHKRRVWRLLRDEVTTPRIRARIEAVEAAAAPQLVAARLAREGHELARRIAASAAVSELRAKYDRVGALMPPAAVAADAMAAAVAAEATAEAKKADLTEAVAAAREAVAAFETNRAWKEHALTKCEAGQWAAAEVEAAQTAAKEAAAAAAAAEAARAAAPAEEEGLPLEGFGGSSKLAALVSLLEGEVAEGDPAAKAVVFTKFGDALGVVGPLLEGRGIGCVTLKQERWWRKEWHGRHAVEVFSEEEACRVMLLEANTAAAGLTLTCARHVVFVDVLNSELLEAQAKARVSRIGQRFPTTAWHLVAQDSVDVPLRAAADKQAEVGGVDVRIGALVQKVLADAAPRERVAPAPLKQVRLKLRGW